MSPPARKGDKTFERVKTVSAAADDVQGQIDFRGGAFSEDIWQGEPRSKSVGETGGPLVAGLAMCRMGH